MLYRSTGHLEKFYFAHYKLPKQKETAPNCLTEGIFILESRCRIILAKGDKIAWF